MKVLGLMHLHLHEKEKLQVVLKLVKVKVIICQDSTTEDYYRFMHVEAQCLVTIKDQFDQPGFKVYKNLEKLLVKAANKYN